MSCKAAGRASAREDEAGDLEGAGDGGTRALLLGESPCGFASVLREQLLRLGDAKDPTLSRPGVLASLVVCVLEPGGADRLWEPTTAAGATPVHRAEGGLEFEVLKDLADLTGDCMAGKS